MTIETINRAVGNIDIYLLDQLLKGTFNKQMKILDAGSGEGRNLHYFIQNGYDVYGVDANPTAIQMLRMSAKNYEPERFVLSSIEDMIFPPNVFDFIICSAVLHFATGHDHFENMMRSMLKVLKPGGKLFIRMTTDLGIEPAKSRGNGVVDLPDGSTRYLFESKGIDKFLAKYQLKLIAPFKSVAVYGQRSMGVLLVQKQ